MNRLIHNAKRYSSLILLLITSLPAACQTDGYVSPDGKFKLVLKVSDGADLVTRYLGKVVSLDSKDTINLFNCLRHDVGRPNFYWSKDSKYLVFEKCIATVADAGSRIVIFYLPQKRNVRELNGMIGNVDTGYEQFDADQSILFYFKAQQGHVAGKIPDLYAFDLNTEKEKRLCSFEGEMDMDLPQVKRIRGKRKLEVQHTDLYSLGSFKKEVSY
jgi:hypothetical protein